MSAALFQKEAEGGGKMSFSNVPSGQCSGLARRIDLAGLAFVVLAQSNSKKILLACLILIALAVIVVANRKYYLFRPSNC